MSEAFVRRAVLKHQFLQMYCRLGQENDYDSSRRKSQSVKAGGVLRLFSFRCFFLSRFPRRFPSIYFDRS